MFLKLATAAIFLLTYAGVAIGRFPGLRIDRAGIALTGAAFTIAVGAISPEEAYRAIDLDTLALLLGMMIVVGHLRLSGFFRLGARWALEHAHSQPVFLIAVALTSGLLSAFLVNDAVCLVMAPLVVETTRALKRDPVPYLLAVAMASNIGSAATITGNPQNMIIGAVSHIPYIAFAKALAPTAALGVILVVVLVAAFSPREFFPIAPLGISGAKARVNKPQMVKAAAVTLGVVTLFFAGAPVGEAAILGGALLLVTRSIKAQKVYREIDGSLLLLFAGLFVVVAGAEKVLLSGDVLDLARSAHLDNVWTLTAVTAALSNVISNVPAVLAIKPFVQGLADPQKVWLVIAMSSTFAGNLTLVGSVANLIVAEKARQQGVEISFWRYARVGVPITVLTLALGAWWLS
jgi:Na+/H+ antiporter NhaD/arsenite permease-like protein